MRPQSSVSVLVLASALLTGCPPPNASCPASFTLGSDGRCVPATDGGIPADARADGGVDTGPAPMPDAGRGADGCVLAPFYADGDHDGHGSATSAMFACEAPTGYVASSDDCDDTCATCHPGTVEICEGTHDENCDGHVDEDCGCTAGATQSCGVSATAPCHMGTQTCAGGTWGACTGNVDPTPETCNAIDDDCNGSIDDGVPTSSWYLDGDGDAYGTGAAMIACRAPTGYVAAAGDCNDASATVHPGASETCNGTDDDCSGAADNGFACVLGSASTCMTVCGSTGTGLCSGTCTAPTGAMCTPPTETCDGLDQDCDGVADENLVMSAGAPVTAIAPGSTTATQYAGTHLVPTASGYALFAQTREAPAHVTMQMIQPNGSPSGGGIPLDSGINPPGSTPWSVRAAGADFLIAYGYFGSATTGTVTVGRVNATGGRLMLGQLTLPPGYSGWNRVVITDADATFATIYAGLRSTTTPYTYTIRRFRVNTTGSTPSVVGSSTDVVTGVWAADVFNAVSTAFGDYVVYVDDGGVTRLVSVASGGAVTPVGVIRAAAADSPVGVAIAIASTTATVSTSNPLAVIWLDLASAPMATTHFVEVRGTAPFSLGTPISLPGGSGSTASLIVYPQLVDVVAVPNGTSETRSGHWFVASSDRVSAASVERAWEVLGGSGAPMAVGQTISTPQGAAGDISIAAGGTSIRLAHAATSYTAITRQLGCR